MRLVRGFTLIELIVTIAVLAVIASIAAPSFSNQIIRQRLDNSGREILSALYEGRSKAVSMRSVVVVCPNKTTGGFITPKECVTKTIAGADGDKFIDQQRVLLANILDDTNVSSTITGVVFLPTGNAQSAQAFTLCSNNISKVITVAATGASEISTGTC